MSISGKKASKLFVLAMAGTLALSTFAGCGSPSGTPASSTSTATSTAQQTDEAGDAPQSQMVSDTPVTFSILYVDNSDYPYNKDWLALQEMTKLTNVSFDAQIVPDADYSNKVKLILNSGSLPDILMKTVAANNYVADYAINGVLYPIGNHIDEMPNLKAKTDTFLAKEWEDLRLSDGQIYTIPGYTRENAEATELWLMRKDLLDKAGLEVPTTMDELFDVCMAIKEQNPGITPIANRFQRGNLLKMMSPMFDTRGGWLLRGHGYIYDTATDSWKFAPTSPEFKSMLETLNRFLEAGLLDIEWNNLDSDVFTQRWASGNIFLTGDWPSSIPAIEEVGKANNPDFSIVGVKPFAGPTGVAKYAPEPKSEGGWAFPARIKDHENLDVLIRLVDWFFSEEGSDNFTWGVEGQTFNIENGRKKLTSDILTPDNLSGTVEIMSAYGLENNCFSMFRSTDFINEFILGEANSILQKELREMDAIPPADPVLNIPEEISEDVALYSTALSDYYNAMTENFIYGRESFDNWDAFEAGCVEKGKDKLGELINQAWQAQQK